MGTALEVTLLGTDVLDLERATGLAFDEVERIESLVSTWRPKSEVSRLNAAAGGELMRVNPELAALLSHATELSRDTSGSFDVTVGPLTALWRDAEAKGRAPSRAELEAARARVGSQHLRIETEGSRARATLAAGSVIDLGGIAKGYALDRVREKLPASIGAALLSFGQSSAWAMGHPPDAPGWRLLARAPDGGFAGVITLRDRALSVSGSLGQSREIAGRRYGHVIDSRSGRPLEERRQALVVSDDATDAEALSKALLVLGPVEGIALIEEWPGAEALLLDADGRSWRTEGWDATTQFETVSDPSLPPEARRRSSPPADAPIFSG
jgi:thiamine biosynthesis lipoprotein